MVSYKILKLACLGCAILGFLGGVAVLDMAYKEGYQKFRDELATQYKKALEKVKNGKI